MVSPDRNMPEELDAVMAAEIRQNVRIILEVLQGPPGKTGMVADVKANKDSVAALTDRVAALEKRTSLKMFPDDAPTIKAKAEAWAIRAGVFLAFLTALVEVFRYLNPVGS